MSSLQLAPAVRAELWTRLAEILEDYAENVGTLRVTSELDPDKIRSILAPIDFSTPVVPLEALDFAARNLTRFQTHTPHPRYFGLFNPAPATMGIAGLFDRRVQPSNCCVESQSLRGGGGAAPGSRVWREVRI